MEQTACFQRHASARAALFLAVSCGATARGATDRARPALRLSHASSALAPERRPWQRLCAEALQQQPLPPAQSLQSQSQVRPQQLQASFADCFGQRLYFRPQSGPATSVPTLALRLVRAHSSVAAPQPRLQTAEAQVMEQRQVQF
jgi:hypothetical protein